VFHTIRIYAITGILQKLALTSLTCGGHSVGIVRSRTKVTEVFAIVTGILSSKLKANLVTPFWILSIALLSFETGLFLRPQVENLLSSTRQTDIGTNRLGAEL
jgi:hypothetical protein